MNADSGWRFHYAGYGAGLIGAPLGAVGRKHKCLETFIEVKSVTLLSNPTIIDDEENDKQGYFPDSVTTRGQKHLRELIQVKQQGHRAVLLFAVLHSGIESVMAAKHIDAKYAELLMDAISQGIEVIAYKAQFEQSMESVKMTLVKPLIVKLNQ